jgi:hypothetical protein
MQGHPKTGCALLAVALLLLMTPTTATKFVANPVSRLSPEHRALIEHLWKVGQQHLKVQQLIMKEQHHPCHYYITAFHT